MQFDEEYYQSEDFQELLESYQSSMTTGNAPFMDADDLVDIADYYNWQGDYDQALEVIDYAMELYPGATLPNVFKARQALMEKDYDSACDYAEQIVQKDDPDYHYLQAEILIAQDRIEEADRYLRDYGMTVGADEYADFVKDCANLYVDYGVSDKAYQWMMRSKGDDSDDFKELMARTLFGLGKYKDSERLFNELIDHNPYSKSYWTALATAQFMDEAYSDSVTSSEYAIAIDPEDPDALISKANGLLRLGNYEQALEYYRRYARQVPDDEFALLHQGECLINLMRHQEALQVLEEAMRVAPEGSYYLPQICQELAFCYNHAGDHDKAMKALDLTKEMECDHSEMLVIRGHLQLESNRLEDAEESFQQAIVQSDNAPTVLLRIMVSLYDNHYVNASYQMFKKFFSIIHSYAPDFNDGYSYMALCCYDLGKTKEFMHYLQQAVQYNPSEARLVLGFMFPPDMKPAAYYDYMRTQMK